MEPTTFVVPSEVRRHYTHRLFRYPAKFHPPVADALLTKYSRDGDTVYDPFCGSGTLMVEAATLNRHSIGSDIDPLAVLISRAKTRAYDVDELEAISESLGQRLARFERPSNAYDELQFKDMPENEYQIEADSLWLPEIPRIDHWFRKYVQIDLAIIWREIQATQCSDNAQLWLQVVFASIIRNASNADPVPVSGLEVTSHMRKKDALGRVINPFALFRAKCKKSLKLVDEYVQARSPSLAEPTVLQADAGINSIHREVDAVITSPPYHSAVDYYRRHQLEMFWLGLTSNQSERLALLPKYIGRARTPMSLPIFEQDWSPSPLAESWEKSMDELSPQRARDFRAYMLSMTNVFQALSEVLPAGKPAVFVVGRSSWNGGSIPTDELFVELAHSSFELADHQTYEIRNRYMSYARSNGANIDEEHVLVFERKHNQGE